MTPKAYRLLQFALPVAVATLASAPTAPARADFLEGPRTFFTQDVPHFFQDDIPCAFGGRPTSGTRASCGASDHRAEPVTETGRAGANFTPPPPPPETAD
jgi:hypothetical protein